MSSSEYHKNIEAYYDATENSYKDSWDLDASLAIHYGYWDEKVHSFRESLARMNEIMVEAAAISNHDHVLDAGCGVGGSSIFIASRLGCRVTGITLSEKQAKQAAINAKNKGVEELTQFRVMNYAATSFPDASFDVVWGCESICYADDKLTFVKEAYRLLKPGGRIVLADGFVTRVENNQDKTIREWLDGWQVNYLETPENFTHHFQQAGFINISYRNISDYVQHSSRRLWKVYFLAKLYLFWKTIIFSNKSSVMQKKNIKACRSQYVGLKRGLWKYGVFTATKPMDSDK